MSKDGFDFYWENKKKSLSLEDFSFSRDIKGPAPHGVALINRELLLSAWLENGEKHQVDELVAALLNAAERMVSIKPQPRDEDEGRVSRRVRRRILDDGEDDDLRDAEPEEDRLDDIGIDYVTLEIVSPNELPMMDYLIHYVDGVLVHPPRRVSPELDKFLVEISFQSLLENAVEHAARRLSLGLISMGNLLPLLEQGEKIYNLNVRAALETSTLTNRRLKDVFDKVASGENPDSGFFPFLNNGLTISYAGKTALADGRYSLINPQVINGQQTLRSWYRKYLECLKSGDDLERLKSLLVPVRLLRLSSNEDVRRVAFANNRQNPISAVDLRSNEPCMISIEKAFRDRNRGVSGRRGGRAIYFLRKSGQTVTDPQRNVIDLGQSDSRLTPSNIYRLYCEMAAAPGNEDLFFDSDDFEKLFSPLSEKLDARKIERLYGLYQVSRINAGAKKRPALRTLLHNLGVHGGAMGVSDHADRRLLTYALWPVIRKAILHALLGNQGWQGADTNVRLFSGSGADTVPTDDLMGLLFPVQLPGNLITLLYNQYTAWKSGEKADGMEEHDLVVQFVREEVPLEYMLECTDIRRANLISDL